MNNASDTEGDKKKQRRRKKKKRKYTANSSEISSERISFTTSIDSALPASLLTTIPCGFSTAGADSATCN